jgi:hypothetical protein
MNFHSNKKYIPTNITHIDSEVNPYKITSYKLGKGLVMESKQLTNPIKAPINKNLNPIFCLPA